MSLSVVFHTLFNVFKENYEVWSMNYDLWMTCHYLSVTHTHTHTHTHTRFRKLWSVKSQGGVLWYFHAYVGSVHFFGVQYSEFQYFFWFSEKWIIFGGMKILWLFFGAHHKIGLVWGSFLCILGSFLKNWDIFWIAKISNIFWGCLKFLIFFWRGTVDAGSQPTYAWKYQSIPPPPPPGCKVSSFNCEEWSHHRFFVVFMRRLIPFFSVSIMCAPQRNAHCIQSMEQ